MNSSKNGLENPMNKKQLVNINPLITQKNTTEVVFGME